MKNQESYYLGLDIGTDSVGYAVTDKEYNLLKFHGEPAWGVTIFDEASLNTERRSFRTSRRRLDRRQQRVNLIQELFANEISKKDARFYIRLKESALYREDVGDSFTLFNDDGFTDKDYYFLYPTIHHLICELMESREPHDVRLVYLACAWLVAHRGHFLSNIDKNNLSAIKDFNSVNSEFMKFFEDNGYEKPWKESDIDIDALSACLKKKTGVTGKSKELISILYGGKKPEKLSKDEEIDPSFPFSREGIIKLLAGGTYALKDLYGKEEYAELETKSISLGMDEEKFTQVMADIGDDYDLIDAMRKIYDWSVLVDVLGDSASVSEAKVGIYEQHKKDLAFLKYFIKKYIPEKYDEIFRNIRKDNYVAYSYHTNYGDTSGIGKKANKEDFSKYINGIVKAVSVDDGDKPKFDDMIARLELRSFLPKQKDTDNRVIPHQLYWYELNAILKNAENYLPFLKDKDENGISVSEKIESVFLFRIPYFVGPLNKDSDKAWIVRKAGKIYPWNFNEMVDLDESENNFIKKMTNKCTYLPGEDVLPKDSLLYHKFTVLNEINNIRINDERISVDLKQDIYNNVFSVKKKVTRRYLADYLIKNGVIAKGEEDSITGIDISINSNLAPQIAFRNLMESGSLSESDVEKIIERASYAEDKSRLSKWLEKNYPGISDVDRKYICSVKIKDFGRLSRRFLDGIEGIDLSTGEVTTVISAMWNTQNNLMEIIADEEKYTFKSVIDDFRKDYYSEHKSNLNERLDEMYVSNAVRRPVYRTLAIIKDVTKAFGVPEKIFVEMTRGATEEQRGKRTKTRKQQILELYEKCRDEDVRILKEQLEAMGDYADSKLQGDKLFLYYMQLGKCMYSGEAIPLENLGSKEYDTDHIYPQAFVKDDSIINNKVLVTSEENGQKSDNYPIRDEVRHKMKGYWDYLKEVGLISEEKYKRLVRATPFTDDEKYGFINRQLTETSQSTKVIATLLKEKYPETEIVYCKARLASEFRQEFDLLKSRSFNDLHHAVDAYLNIVTGNVYNMKFTRRWFSVNSVYSLKTKTIFTHPVVCGGETVWDGENMLAKVKATAVKNTAHFTKFAFFKKGGFFNQNPLCATGGLVPLKKDMPTEKYGGYSGVNPEYLLLVKYKAGKKHETIFFPVPHLLANDFDSKPGFAEKYIVEEIFSVKGKTVSDVEFLLNRRKIKINTVLSIDGLRVVVNGGSFKDGRIPLSVITQFAGSSDDAYYLKKIERLIEKSGKYNNYVFSAEYDNINSESNLNLYRRYVERLRNSIYSKTPGIGSMADELEKAESKFISLTEIEQAKVLIQIHSIFTRCGSSGIDLKLLGLSSRSATCRKSLYLSGWIKDCSDVRIIDSSVSGLWEKKSDNLLELI
ncbi:MAG: type II CRISPR RNA-guided endonuclease Cas9 [Clostridia bacterium]|nr:type II CRISPR RNA-guided endonuclease Cas9 [Clostridia bacterium]